MSKEIYKRDLYIRKETYNRKLQKRPTQETNQMLARVRFKRALSYIQYVQRDLQKRPMETKRDLEQKTTKETHKSNSTQTLACVHFKRAEVRSVCHNKRPTKETYKCERRPTIENYKRDPQKSLSRRSPLSTLNALRYALYVKRDLKKTPKKRP